MDLLQAQWQFAAGLFGPLPGLRFSFQNKRLPRMQKQFIIADFIRLSAGGMVSIGRKLSSIRTERLVFSDARG
jgi:hypothetical protein